MNLGQYKDRLNKYIDELDQWSQAQGVECKRKAVGCGIVCINTSICPADPSAVVEVLRTTNGPTPGHVCTGEVGNCGCAHAEPLAILTLMNLLNRQDKFVLCCNYSPCTRCSHVIIASDQVAGLVSGVVYKRLTTHDVRGRDLLIKAGLTVLSLDPAEQPHTCIDNGGFMYGFCTVCKRMME